ncbi:MAG TPA: LirA/MavJ family T4SS effector [Myxococcaceae bacterium]
MARVDLQQLLERTGNELVADCVRIQQLLVEGYMPALEYLEAQLPDIVLGFPKDAWPKKVLTQHLVAAEKFCGLNVNAPIYTAVLSENAFKEYSSNGALFKDVGAGLLHGEFTHRIQWYVIFHAMSAGFEYEAVKEKPAGEWKHPPRQLLININMAGVRVDADLWPRTSREPYKGLWDALFDRLRFEDAFDTTEDGITSPEDFNLRLLDKTWLKANHRSVYNDMKSKGAAFGALSTAFPKLSRIVTQRYIKRKSSGFTGTVVPKPYVAEKLKNNYKLGSENTVLELRLAEEKKKGHCFLTTACVEARGLPDDCEELQVLRAFRDGYLRQRPGGAGLIAHYYAIAPRILEAIHRGTDAPAVFERIYASVRHVVGQIQRGEHEAALWTYAALVEGLSEAHLVQEEVSVR